MADKKQIAIKERILKQAMEFWGVSDIRDMDPVIDLLLEVFAHESNKLHQEIEQSDCSWQLIPWKVRYRWRQFKQNKKPDYPQRLYHNA